MLVLAVATFVGAIALQTLFGAFGFVLAHGASAFAAIRIRSEREPSRVAALLDLSGTSMSLMYVSLLVLVGAGIAAGSLKPHGRRL